MSEIRADKIHNVTGDNDSGIDLSTNDQVIIKTANTTAVTVDSSQDTTLSGNIKKTGDLTLDVSGDIVLDADGGDVNFQDGGTLYGFMAKSSDNLLIGNAISDGDVLIRGNDGGSNITAVTFDMSAGGNVLIGATSSIGAAGGARFQLSQSNNNWVHYIENYASSGDIYGTLVRFSGQSPDNNTSAFMKFQDGGGTVRCNIYSDGDLYNHDGTYAQISDRRIKDNITDANSQWDDIKAMRFVNYQRKDDIRQYGTDKAKVQLGLIGQELEKVSPNLVRSIEPNEGDIIGSSEFGTLYEDGDTIPEGKKIGDVKEVKDKVKGVAYSILYMKAVKALQEAMTRIETLEAKVTALESK